jgi:hypothetical protein
MVPLFLYFVKSIGLGGIKTGVIDCGAKLPSGGTLKSKFKLDKDKGFPVLFAVANGLSPRQLKKNDLKTSDRIISFALDFTR